MRQKEEIKNRHNGCPYRHSCKKDESKCCYLIGNRCIVNEFHDNYVFKQKKDRII